MGRYPFLEVGMRYMAKRKPYLAETTYDDLVRKVKYLSKVFVELKRDGKVRTTNPERMNYEDIGTFVEYIRETGSQNYLVSILRFLKQICEYAGNNVFAEMRAGGEPFPKKIPKNLTSLSARDLKCLQEAAESIHGWTGEVARFIVAIYPYTGLRASELRLAHIEDIDTNNWTIFVRHPKGEQRYAPQRYAPILRPARSAVSRFLEARKQRLHEHGVQEVAPLIPAYFNGQFVFYGKTGFRTIKDKLEEITAKNGNPIRFHLKTFRDTFCQMNIDKDPTHLTQVSIAMGHRTTNTTETHYGRMKAGDALNDLQRSWDDTVSDFNPPMIDGKNVIAGST